MAALSEKTKLACWLARQVQVLVGASLLWCSGLLSCWNSKTGLHLEWLSSDYVDPLCGADVKPAIKCLLEPAGSWVGRPRCALNGIYFIVLLSAPPLPSLVTSPYPSQHMAALSEKTKSALRSPRFLVCCHLGTPKYACTLSDWAVSTWTLCARLTSSLPSNIPPSIRQTPQQYQCRPQKKDLELNSLRGCRECPRPF